MIVHVDTSDETGTATATVHNAALWTLNTADFRDIPVLRLIH